MKKKLFSIAIVALSLFGTSAMAQTANQTKQQCTQTECVAKGKGDCAKAKGDCAKKGKGDKKQRHGAGKADLFKGMTLTEAQKTQLQELQTQRMEARKQAKAAQRDKKKELKQQKDSTMRAAREAEMRDYLAKVKKIVGADQYVIFLENIAVNTPVQNRQMVKKAPKLDRHGAKGTKGGKK